MPAMSTWSRVNGSRSRRSICCRIGRPPSLRRATPPTPSECERRHTKGMLLVDAANVVGSRPNGWWRDRAGAARTLVEQLHAAVGSGRLAEPVIVVLEGAARGGVEEGVTGGVTVLHAPGSSDDTLL